MDTAARRGRRRVTASRPTAIILMLAVVITALSVGIAFLRVGALTAEEQVHDVAAELRCPSCLGESVADSSAPVAEAMRATIIEKVASGDSREEILSWFHGTYGADILLDPVPSGVPLLFWIIPVLLVAAAAYAAIRRRRWRWTLGFGVAAALVIAAPLVAPADRVVDASEGAPDVVAILTSAVADDPSDVRLRRYLADALSSAGDDSGALNAYAAAYRLQPSDAGTASDYAAALLAADRIDEASLVLERVLAREPDEERALLLMAAVRSESGDPSAVDLYRRFLVLEPESPLRESIEAEILRLERW